jgi:hypothetical protein
VTPLPETAVAVLGLIVLTQLVSVALMAGGLVLFLAFLLDRDKKDRK